MIYGRTNGKFAFVFCPPRLCSISRKREKFVSLDDEYAVITTIMKRKTFKQHGLLSTKFYINFRSGEEPFFLGHDSRDSCWGLQCNFFKVER